MTEVGMLRTLHSMRTTQTAEVRAVLYEHGCMQEMRSLHKRGLRYGDEEVRKDTQTVAPQLRGSQRHFSCEQAAAPDWDSSSPPVLQLGKFPRAAAKPPNCLRAASVKLAYPHAETRADVSKRIRSRVWIQQKYLGKDGKFLSCG